MKLRELMDAFVREAGLGSVGPNDAGAYHLDFDDMTVAFRETEDASRLLIFGAIGELPPEGAEIFCRVMLKAMFLEGAVSGAAFSIDPETERLFLQRQEPLSDLDLARFKALVESFVNELEKWRGSVDAFRPVSAEIGKEKTREAEASGEISSNGFLKV